MAKAGTSRSMMGIRRYNLVMVLAVLVCVLCAMPACAQHKKRTLPPAPKALVQDNQDSVNAAVTFLHPFLFNIGGQGWIQTSATRASANTSALPQSSLALSIAPRIAYLVSARASLGVELAYDLAQATTALTAPTGQARRERYYQSQLAPLPQVTLYQPVVPRLYVFERLAVGPGFGTRSVTLVDSLSAPVADQGYRTTSGQAILSGGAVLFFREQLAFTGQIGYLYAIDNIRSYGAATLGPGHYGLPTGTYHRQGLQVRVGIEIFLRAKPFK